MLGITDLSTYLVGLTLIILLPGPNSIYVLSVAARRGWRAGYAAAGGVFMGDLVLMLLAAGGVASLLQATPALFSIIKWAGATYLGWLAIGLLRGAWAAWRARARVEPVVTEALEDAAPAPGVKERPMRRALVVSLLNPKAILFFVSFFVQFIDPAYAHPELTFLALAGLVQLFSLTYLSVLIFGGSYLAATFRKRERLRAVMSALVGTAFLGFAIKLTTASAA
jgi:leucine efflux protein